MDKIGKINELIDKILYKLTDGLDDELYLPIKKNLHNRMLHIH